MMERVQLELENTFLFKWPEKQDKRNVLEAEVGQHLPGGKASKPNTVGHACLVLKLQDPPKLLPKSSRSYYIDECAVRLINFVINTNMVWYWNKHLAEDDVRRWKRKM